jgi:hypothetical protein
LKRQRDFWRPIDIRGTGLVPLPEGETIDAHGLFKSSGVLKTGRVILILVLV